MIYNRLVVALLLAIPVAGFLIEFLLRKSRLRGYGHVAGDVRIIAKAIKGELDRDFGDLLIRGSMNSTPVLIRISNSDQRPGLNIQVPAAAHRSLYCVPKEHNSEGGHAALPLSDPSFNARFQVSSDEPAIAQMLFGRSEILAEIQKVCITAGSSLTLEDRRLELIEQVLPEENLAQRVLEAVPALLVITEASRQMSGADAERPVRALRQWNWFRTAYLGVPLLVLCSMALVARLQKPPQQPKPAVLPTGIPDDLAAQVPQLQEWRLAETGDFDPDAVAWLRQQGYEPNASLSGALAGSERQDSAYVLKHSPASAGEPRRLLVFLKGQLRFDANMPEIAMAARIPKSRMGSIEWRGGSPAGQADGDGILIIQKYKDPSSAMVLFASGVQLLIGRPKDFHRIELP